MLEYADLAQHIASEAENLNANNRYKTEYMIKPINNSVDLRISINIMYVIFYMQEIKIRKQSFIGH